MPDLLRARDSLEELDWLFEGLHTLGVLVDTCDDTNCYQKGIATLVVLVAEAGRTRVEAGRKALDKD